MKLADLQNEINRLALQLETALNTTVKTGLSLNPEDLSEVVVTLSVKTVTNPLVETTEDVAKVVS